MRLIILLLSAAVIAFPGCGDDDETIAPTATVAESGDVSDPTGPTATVEVTAEPTAEPTEVAELTAEAVIQALQAAGLPIVEIQVYTAETDPNEQLGRPHGYTSKANFADERLEHLEFEGVLTLDSGGSVEAFDNKDDAEDRFEYLDAVARGILGEYHYLRGAVILRISKSFTPDQAAAYEAAFEGIVP